MLGIDSLVAVEVRSWPLKDFKVDIPVLKVVGGASLTELCQRVIDRKDARTAFGDWEKRSRTS